MRYYRGEIDIKALIDAGLAIRVVARDNKDVSEGDIVLALAAGYEGWEADLIDTILDHEERARRVAKRFRSWRKGKR